MNTFALWYLSTFLWLGIFITSATFAPRVAPGFAVVAIPVAMAAGALTVVGIYLALIEVVVQSLTVILVLFGFMA